MKAVHFGAGNIGRGFVGLLLSQSGYEVCFITRNQEKVNLLRQLKQYTVTLANELSQTITVNNVTALSVHQHEAVAEVIATADLVTTAVGAGNLEAIAASIARGIERRLSKNPRPLNIMACENAIDGSTKLKEYVFSHISPELYDDAKRYIAFPNVVVDRIVPAFTDSHPLAIRTEPFFEWVIDGSAVLGELPPITGVQYVESLDPFVERKLFTLNTGHCSAAYLGYAAGYQTIQQVMGNPLLREKIRLVLQETGNLLIQKHGFNRNDHKRYVQKIMQRFANPFIVDKIERVGRSPIRKLSPDERLVRPAMEAHGHNLATSHLTKVMAAGLMFDHADDAQATTIQTMIQEKGADATITKYTGIPRKHPLHEKVLRSYQQFTRTVSHAAISL
ncbi:mannitol-1-phosphate 5-dehydrogenase [Desulfosporosinus shakirovi]|uniref:mannitol-1-phosphate 5-dehydrogenase n=1 Tax=Desulfosporosinus shakirovi TaxID=2885154 RepID=UPI001E4030CB|nr:mannitol-1-phosphate 5-dehydrogenase [Desulfosporosinus sp. SRJS8]MCB8817667.1 mannitol-1-phosphate 5-dehydrogenase [Desulfosporosinus sp. SRJS8]